MGKNGPEPVALELRVILSVGHIVRLVFSSEVCALRLR